MGHRQKGKHKKRRKSWHRLGADRRWLAAERRLDRARRKAARTDRRTP